MNILPQILNYETKSFYINSSLQKIKVKLVKIISSIYKDLSKFKYIDFFLSLQREINLLVKELVVDFISLLDKSYKDSIERKKYYYINKSNVSRTIFTIYGEITFERTLYRNKSNNKDFYYFVDDVLNLESYKLYDPIVRGITISDAVNYNPNNASYHSSLDYFNVLNYLSRNNRVSTISRQSVYRWIRECESPSITYEPIDNRSTLYVMADEKWIHKQDRECTKKKKWIMSKCFIIFTHIKSKGRRNILKGKHIFITISPKPYKELMDEICKIYDFEKIKTINLLSDAGTWILAGKSELKLYSHNRIVVNTCEFHVKQKICRSTKNKDLREILSNAIYEKEDKKLFIQVMNAIIKSNEKQSRKDKITSYKNYIVKHWKGIIAMKYSSVKSSMESHISHCIASHFGSRPKAYSDKYIQTYLKFQEASLNNINILDFYLKFSCSNKLYSYNEKEINFSIFDKSKSNLPIRSSANPISIIINEIVNFNSTF